MSETNIENIENARDVKNKKEKKRTPKHFEKKSYFSFTIVTRLIFIIIFITSAVYLMYWMHDNKANSELSEHLSQYITINSDDSQDISIDYNKLKQENEYFFAWLIVNGTNINYPVVHYTDNDYYLTHAFDNSSNQSGCSFADYRAKCDGTDQNLVIYAHNRKNGSMFATLINTLKEDWYSNNDNHIIKLYTSESELHYQVFSVYEIKAENYYTVSTFASDEMFTSFLSTIKSRSIYDFNVDLTSSDQILTLSTCSNNNANRTVLHAKKVVNNI